MLVVRGVADEDRIVATRTSRTTMREECSEIESRRRRTMEESEGKDAVYATLSKQGLAATETARNIREVRRVGVEKFRSWRGNQKRRGR